MTDVNDEESDRQPEAVRGTSQDSVNPYRSPETNEVAPLEDGRKRLGIIDWIVAILLGILAAIFVFPTTCMGALILLGPLSDGGQIILSISSLAAIAAAFYVCWSVLRARSNRSDL